MVDLVRDLTCGVRIYILRITILSTILILFLNSVIDGEQCLASMEHLSCFAGNSICLFSSGTICGLLSY